MKKTRKDLITEVLLSNKGGMHVNDIAAEMIRRGMVDNISKEELAAKVSLTLSTDVKKRRGAQFKRVKSKKGRNKRGYYKLKSKPRTDKKKILSEIEKSIRMIPTVPALYTGKAGEYAVLAELLFHEFNASLMSVDQGIDIVTSKNDNFSYIQVKTASYKNGHFYATINSKQFERYNNKDTFYIIVLRYILRGKLTNGFLIFKSSDIERYKEMDVIKNGPTLNLTITINDEKMMLNGKENVSFFFDRFQYIN
jgi:hypothetical protein